MNTLALALSGGASKGAFTAGVVKYLLEGKHLKFDIAVGTSTGALVGGPALLDEAGELQNLYTSIEDDDIYTNSTLGTFVNMLDLMGGPIGADMDGLRRLLEKYYITKGKLGNLCNHPDGKLLVVSAINARTGKVVFVDSDMVKDGRIDGATFVDAVVASCSEPFFTKPIQIFKNVANPPIPDVRPDDLFYDGGVKEFIPIEHCAALGAEIVWAISTHPPNPHQSKISAQNEPSLFEALKWAVTAMGDEIARGDRFRGNLYNRWCKIKNEIVKRAIAEGLNDVKANRLVDFSKDDDLLHGLLLKELHVIAPEEELPTSLEFDPGTMSDYLAKGYVRTEYLDQHNLTRYKDDSLKPWYMPF
jgi:predicted acylesterase/phospholipase RssA